MDEQHQHKGSTTSTDNKAQTPAHALPDCPYHHDCANCPLNTGKENDQKTNC
jgi:hypothetical protein